MFCQTGFFVIFTQTLDFPVGKRLCKIFIYFVQSKLFMRYFFQHLCLFFIGFPVFLI